MYIYIPSILEEEKMFSDPQVDRKLTQVTGKLIASETESLQPVGETSEFISSPSLNNCELVAYFIQ